MTLPLAARSVTTFNVDCAKWIDPPLVKTRFGVYQTPLVRLPRLLDSVPLLEEIGVQDLRYEMGWGKPDVLAYDQVHGSADDLKYDFSAIDAWVSRLKQA